jgi:hypothetical protein
VRQWAAIHAEAQGLWWPQPLRTAAEVRAADVENAEMQVLDYLQGWRSIVPVYEAIFDFDMEDALRRMEARSLVLELLTPQEMHFGAQAERLRAVMKRARAASLHGDGEAFETRPRECAAAILEFLG